VKVLAGLCSINGVMDRGGGVESSPVNACPMAPCASRALGLSSPMPTLAPVGLSEAVPLPPTALVAIVDVICVVWFACVLGKIAVVVGIG
jgi:hypothetical protein